MDATKVLIVGGGGAIAGQLIRQYQLWSQSTGQPLELYVTSRQRPPAIHSGITWLQVDFRNPESITAAGEELSKRATVLDHWVCCAGYLHGDFGLPEKALKSLQAAKLSGDFAVNSVGPLLMFQVCLGLLKRAPLAKAVFLSAQVGSIEDNRSGGWYGYRAAKAAQNQLLRCLSLEWSRRWPKATVTLLHPGTTDTDLSRPFQSFVPPEKLFSPERAGRQLVDLLLEQTPEQSGAFLAWDGQPIVW